MPETTEIKVDKSVDELVQKSIGDVIQKSLNEFKAEMTARMPIPVPAQDDKFGFKHVGENLRAIYLMKTMGTVDPRLKAITTYSSAVTAGDGQYLVPPVFVNNLFAIPNKPDPILERVYSIPWNNPGNVATLPTDLTTAAYNASTGNTIETRTESQAKTATKDVVLAPTVSLTKYSSFVPMSDEYLSDTFGDMLQFRIKNAVEKIQYAEAAAVMTAALAVAGCISVNAYSQGNFYWIDALAMYQRIYPSFRSNAVWVVSAPAETELWNMSFDPSATAGTVPVMLQGGNAASEGFNTLLGRPVIVHASRANLGVDNSVVLVDLGQVIGFRKGNGPIASTSEHFAFDQDITVLRVTDRFGAGAYMTSAIAEAQSGTGTTGFGAKINY